MRWRKKRRGSESANVRGKESAKSSAECSSNSPRAHNSARAQHQPSSPTPSLGTHTRTRVKNNPPSPNKTITTTVHRSITLRAMARVRARRRLPGCGIRRGGAFTAKSMVGKKKNILIGLIRRLIRMPEESDLKG
jgi:hypothetical protein